MQRKCSPITKRNLRKLERIQRIPNNLLTEPKEVTYEEEIELNVTDNTGRTMLRRRPRYDLQADKSDGKSGITYTHLL